MARNSFFTAIFIILNVYWVSASPAVKAATCAKCHTLSTDKVNVHLVPHSHDDVGWVSTVEEYYKGSGDGKTPAQASVKKILDSTIEALKKNSARRYVQVETAFFWMWWQEQKEETKKEVINLVNKGQLEMINGGLSMNDEADTNYQSIIDQFTWGLEILDQTVGSCGRPKIGWQIDPFGHSREHASILKQMGFEGLVIGRIDHNDKEDRKKNKALDFNWKTSNTLNESEIFTTIFPNFYTYEKDFCFDILNGCQDTITDDSKIANFEKILTTYAEYYQTKNILIPMGGDFTYQKAETNFNNTDKLIEGFKDNKNFNVFYSTPSCYIKAVQDAVKASKITLPIKEDDFFPYASGDHAYWAGYFTSRPTVKRFERVGNNILQSVKQLMALSKLTNDKMDKDEEKNNDEKLNKLRIAMGVLQHHDAITGTEKQKVANDYVSMLHTAIKDLEEPVGKIVANFLKKSDVNTTLDLKLTNCLLANVSICSTSGKDKFLAVIQNPLSRVVDHYIRLPVDGTSFKITGPAGEVKYDVFNAIADFAYVKEAEKPLPNELVFKAEKIPPLGINVYYIENLKDSNESNYYPFKDLSDKDTVFGKQNKFEIDFTTKKLKSITINGQSLNVTQEFLYYDSFTSDTCNVNDSQRCSGAYIFRPAVGKTLQADASQSKIEFAKGSLVHEVRQTVNAEVTQIIRIYLDQKHVEFDWLVGDLQTDKKGKEIITRFKVDNFATKGVFYTDSNGREQITRTRNDQKGLEPIASNYYPVTSRIVIKDDNTELAILNDRAQGGSSLNDGEIELMVHRRLLKDDGFGVDEPLNEVEYENVGLHARGHHYLTFGPIKSTAAYERELAHQKLRAPWVLLADATAEPLNSLETIQKSIEFTYKPINDTILDNSVQILTLEPWTDSSYLLRLEHILEPEEGPSEVSVQLNKLFGDFKIQKYGETKLAANLGQNKNIKWQAFKEDKVTLHPMQIKTVLLSTAKLNGSASLTATSFLVLLMAFIYTIV